MYTIFFILLITITCVVVNINRKEQNKTEEKKTECAEMQLFEYPTQYSQDEKTTLKTWTIMETLVGGTGFLVALLISFFV